MTPVDFKALYPSFANEPDIAIEEALNLGRLKVQGWIEAYKQTGEGLYAAHWLENKRSQEMIAATAMVNLASGQTVSASNLSKDTVTNHYLLAFNELKLAARNKYSIGGLAG